MSIARVLAQSPRVFFLDESTSLLGIRHQIAINDWVKQQEATVTLALYCPSSKFLEPKAA
ncbi:MAG: hypothetical protein MK208_20860 [Shimia sp.]|nr:hypothetical protein [Shimia sp.]